MLKVCKNWRLLVDCNIAWPDADLLGLPIIAVDIRTRGMRRHNGRG